MDSEFSAAYVYEPRSFAAFRTMIVVIFILVGIYVLFELSKHRRHTVAAYVPMGSSRRTVATSLVFICIDEDNRLENVGLTIHDSSIPRYLNVPVDPILIEAQLDGSMARTVAVAGRYIHRIELPREMPVSSIALDMTINRQQSVFVFLEDGEGRRVWEKNVRINPGRFHTMEINGIKFT